MNSADESIRSRITPAQRQQERALSHAVLLDTGAYFGLIAAAVLSGSLTMWAELARGTLFYVVEVIALITLWRSNRGKLSAYEYGIGKIERSIMIVVAAGLYMSAFVILQATIGRMGDPASLSTPAMMLAILIGSTNLLINAYCTGEFLRANALEESLIIETQIRTRLVKTAASLVVVVVLVIASWLADPKGATYVDAMGALFVIGYMIVSATKMLRESIPDLLDRALPEQEQLAILRVLARNFEEFDRFCRIRSRRSAGRAYIDVHLYFDRDLPLKDAAERCSTIVREVQAAIPGSVPRVKPHARVASSARPDAAQRMNEGAA